MTTARSRFVPLLVTVPLSLYMLFSPGSAVPSGPRHSDKVVHLLLFAALAGSALVAGARIRAAVPVLLAYAVLSEILQETLPIQRSGEVWDVVADASGIAIGVAGAVTIGAWCRRIVSWTGASGSVTSTFSIRDRNRRRRRPPGQD